MWAAKFALEDDGTLQWIDLGATAVSGFTSLNGAAYDQGTQRLFVTTEAVAAADPYIGGFRYRSDGALRVYDATAAVPAGANTNQGIALTSDGQLCYTLDMQTRFSLNGVSLDSARRVNALPLAFLLEFADLGAGVVSTVEAITGATPTFTRATVAWTKLSTGLWAEVASGSPRSFYSGFTTAVGTYLGYLAEGERTQLVTPDASIRDMTDAAWVAGATMSVAKTGIGIDGVVNSCSRLTGGGVAATNTILQTLTAAASSRTYSVWLRRVTGTGVVNITQDGGSTWTAVTSDLVTANFVRVSLTASVLNAAFGIQVETDGDVVLADFNQFEAGAFASTPIATASTRNADVLTYPTTGWLNAAAGTVFVDFTTDAVVTAAIREFVYISDGTANERIIIDSSSGGLLRGIVTDGGVTQATPSTGITVSASTNYKAAMAYAANDFAISGNGGTVGTDTSGTIPTVTTLTVGIADGGSAASYFPIRRVSYYGARLANATLQGLTA